MFCSTVLYLWIFYKYIYIVMFVCMDPNKQSYNGFLRQQIVDSLSLYHRQLHSQRLHIGQVWK
jgi:hypothetical protein